MFAKKLVVLAGTALMLTASAAFAAGYYDSYGRYVYYPDRVLVERPTTYYAPAPTYYYSTPAPSYYYAPSGAATGAVAGALIGGSLADRHHRGAGVAAGAILGAAIGSSYDYPRYYGY